jgi:ankyrin repeat protein
MAGWECEDERIKGTLGVLLEYGADPNAQDVMGRTPLYYAWQSRTFLALSTEQPDLTAMSERACNRDVLLKDGADASIRDRLGFTASQIACQFCETFNGRAAWGTGLYG